MEEQEQAIFRFFCLKNLSYDYLNITVVAN